MDYARRAFFISLPPPHIISLQFNRSSLLLFETKVDRADQLFQKMFFLFLPVWPVKLIIFFETSQTDNFYSNQSA